MKQADKDAVRPDSARGILRRLAKITAQTVNTRDEGMRALGKGLGKENVRPADDEEEEEGEGEGEVLKKPRLTLDVEEDESLDIDASELPEGYEDDEETEELPAAPTPSVLPDEDDTRGTRLGDGERSLTFKSIDFANARRRGGERMSDRTDRRKSRVSFAQLRSEADGPASDEEDDPTILTERGRRAISEEMTGRLSRYSFGSIRMSDFGDELEVRRESDPRFQAKSDEIRKSFGGNDALLEGETELLDRLRQSTPQSPDVDEDEEGPIIDDGADDDFQLFLPEEEEAEEAQAKRTADTDDLPQPQESSKDETAPGALQNHQQITSPPPSRRLTSLETSALTSQATNRKKRQKMTRHGTMVPSLPSSLIKRIATDSCVRNGRRRPQLGKDHMKALEQATEWFFEQVGEDLAAYAEHGRRKKRVDASDVMMLMRRQRVDLEDVASLARQVLPREVAAELDLDDDDES